MEYKIKIELMDASDNVMARTVMSEGHAKAVKSIYDVDVLLDTVNIMKNALDAERERLPSDKQEPPDIHL